MIIEYIRYGLLDEPQARAFEEDYGRAAAILNTSEHCLGYELSRCVEGPLQYVLRIEWDSTQGHVEGFRRNAAFAEFLSFTKPYFAQILEMRHYDQTAVVSAMPPRQTATRPI